MRACERGRGVDALVVPSEDAHQSEYVAECFQRRQFLSGFSGTAGTAVVTREAAALWTDGRYFLQAEKELGEGWELMRAGLPATPEMGPWLVKQLQPGARVGIDASLHTVQGARTLQRALGAGSVEAVPLAGPNLVDAVWDGRPEEPAGAVRVHPLKWAGEDVPSKLARMRVQAAEAGADALVASGLDEVAWLFNIRGQDLEFCTVTLAYGMVTKNAATLYIDEAKLLPEAAEHLRSAGVSVRPYGALSGDIEQLAGAGQKILMDPARVNYALHLAASRAGQRQNLFSAEKVGGAARGGAKGRRGKRRKTQNAPPAGSDGAGGADGVGAGGGAGGCIVECMSPITAAKAVKNSDELKGMREAHVRDGVALAHFLCWLEKAVGSGEEVTEITVSEKLIELRGKQPGFIEPSFPTIAGEGPNGAIVHYRPAPETCRSVGPDSMLLVDSGAQFDCGTTDVTRTVHLGEPSQHQRDCFTRVLKGHIAIARCIFPAGTAGFLIDAFARRDLWEAGLDYRHGTGHGVGAALNVHEGPFGISPRPSATHGIVEGMIVSNEPGYYEDGAFGIRMENLVEICEAKTEFNFGGNTFLGSAPLTLAPISKKLINVAMLSPGEVEWLDDYHDRVRELVAPKIEDEDVRRWLDDALKPIGTE